MSTPSRLLLALAAVMLLTSIFVPIWRIELDAPQYPEGLELLIYSDNIGGDVDIINGLNHYIGMETLHTENFLEFTLLPYIIGAFALFSLIVALANKKKLLFVLFGAFVLFGILAMVDFWRWEYNYGHNLNPNAAIQIPGMSYQPPLIGFKQLLNFGAYSVPTIGGWLFIISGLFMLMAVLFETKLKSLVMKKDIIKILVVTISMFTASCSSSQPEPISLNKDQCEFCKMTISDGHFGSELLTKKGRVYKFDDIGCMARYAQAGDKADFASYYVNDFTKDNALINAETATYVSSDDLNSPMGGNYAAFDNEAKAKEFIMRHKGTLTTWEEIIK
jgi:copper chaperone NosL